MTTVGVVGLGTMGLGIAQVFARAGFDVVATDAQGPAREGARERMAGQLAQASRLTEEDRAAALGRLRIVAGPEGLRGAELVVEAIAEDLGAKRTLFAKLEGVVAPGAVLATNTSSLPVARIAEGLRHPERVVGLHFFNPAPAQRLVELVRHEGTSEAALALARRLAEAAGQTVIDAPDRPGFIVNRCARPFYGEAFALLEEGRAAREIDAVMRAAGYRIGPFALIDLIGADVHLAATRAVREGMGGHPRYHVFPALEAQVASGALGRKTGRGFVFPEPPCEAPSDARAVAARIEATLVNEAGWLLAEGGVAAEAVDAATKLALSWPRGPFEILTAQGREEVRAALASLEVRAPAHLRGRYAPAPILEGS